MAAVRDILSDLAVSANHNFKLAFFPRRIVFESACDCFETGVLDWFTQDPL